MDPEEPLDAVQHPAAHVSDSIPQPVQGSRDAAYDAFHQVDSQVDPVDGPEPFHSGMADGLHQLRDCCNQGLHAVHDEIDDVPAKRLPVDVLQPVLRLGTDFLQGLRQGLRQALHPVRYELYDVLSKRQPVEGREHRHDSFYDLRDVRHQRRYGLHQPHRQLGDQLYPCCQQLRGIVVYDAGYVRDDGRDRLYEDRDIVYQGLRQRHDQVQARIHQQPRILPQRPGKFHQRVHGYRYQFRQAVRNPLRQAVQDADPGPCDLRQGIHDALEQRRDDRLCSRQDGRRIVH